MHIANGTSLVQNYPSDCGVQWDTSLIPVLPNDRRKIVELPDGRRRTLENHAGDCGVQWDTSLIPVLPDDRRKTVELPDNRRGVVVKK